MRKILVIFAVVLLHAGCMESKKSQNPELLIKILEDERLDVVLEMAKKTLKPENGQFKAGSNYPETWIRDFATFIEIALEVNDKEIIKERLMLFFDFQGEQIVFTASREVSYENVDVDMCIYWNNDGQLLPGSYQVHLYADGHEIGTSSFGLR